jgi:RNA polymerase sigma-70 factor (ECF subfamily)
MPADDPRSDEELVRAANSGEEAAFTALYLRYRDWVVSLALRLTDSREEALDIAQEVFLWLLQLFPGFELRAKLKTVLYPAVRNAAITRGRRCRPTMPLPLDNASVAVEHISASSDDLDPRESREALLEVLSKLSDIHHEILILRFADDLSLEEIAVAIGLPMGTVKSRLHNALAALREDPRTKKYYFE